MWDAYAEKNIYIFSRSLSSADMYMCLFVNPVISNFFTLKWLLHKSDTIFLSLTKKTRFFSAQKKIALFYTTTAESSPLCRALQVIAFFWWIISIENSYLLFSKKRWSFWASQVCKYWMCVTTTDFERLWVF